MRRVPTAGRDHSKLKRREEVKKAGRQTAAAGQEAPQCTMVAAGMSRECIRDQTENKSLRRARTRPRPQEGRWADGRGRTKLCGALVGALTCVRHALAAPACLSASLPVGLPALTSASCPHLRPPARMSLKFSQMVKPLPFYLTLPCRQPIPTCFPQFQSFAVT